MAPRAALVDYGAGNLRSVGKALERSGFVVDVTADASSIRAADAVVLPGAGAFADAMNTLHASGLEGVAKEAAASGKPYLGLCLGLQLLFDESDEHGVTKGFGLLGGRVERFPEKGEDGEKLTVPQIGWNRVRFRGEHPMLAHMPEEDWFYFVNSYRVVPADPGVVVGTTNYGGEFASAVASERIFAVQFHPEKSQVSGKRLLDAFRGWVETTR